MRYATALIAIAASVTSCDTVKANDNLVRESSSPHAQHLMDNLSVSVLDLDKALLKRTFVNLASSDSSSIAQFEVYMLADQRQSIASEISNASSLQDAILSVQYPLGYRIEATSTSAHWDNSELFIVVHTTVDLSVGADTADLSQSTSYKLSKAYELVRDSYHDRINYLTDNLLAANGLGQHYRF